MQFRNGAAFAGPKLIGLWLLLFCVSLVSTGCGGNGDQRVIPTDIPFRGDGVLDFIGPDGHMKTRIAIEIAESDSAQARGLMGRRSLPRRGGMLFIDPEPSERSFWMKNTPLALDLIFVRSDSTIANIARRTTPYSEAHIDSDGLAQFVIEVRAGFTNQYNITAGDRVRWQRDPATRS